MMPVEAVLQGNRLALARLLTQIENDTPQGRQALVRLFPYTGRAHWIGITGAPGTGKSSLVNALARYFRQLPEALRVAVVAVDPSSPFSGGAILGDRVRMRDVAGDPGVFIRSMASRGSLGGLARSTAGVAQALDAAGFDVILIETVGAGQAEVDIARLAHTTLVIEAPGLGDDIQAIKAGILEIADVLVINKADQPGVEAAERALRSMLQLAHPIRKVFQDAAEQSHHQMARGSGPVFTEKESAKTESVPVEETWIPPIQRTIAVQGNGIVELVAAIHQHRRYLQESGGWQRREQARLQAEVELLVQETLMARWRSCLTPESYWQVLQAVFARSLAPDQAVEILLGGGRP